MKTVNRFFKRNSHNVLFKIPAGIGRALNRLYENRNHDLYSNGELTILKKISKLNPSIIIDAGANVGKYSILCNKFNPNTKIYSFEPVSNTYKKLADNVGHFKNIFPINKGLYKEHCTKEINIFPSDTHSSLYNLKGISYESREKQEIKLIRGDDFMKSYEIDEIDLMKLDLEGAEYDALLGFEEHIENGKIKMIQFEYGYINISTKKLLIDFYDYFENKDYVIGKIYPKNVEFRKYQIKYEDFLGPNYIAVKNTETELLNLLARK